MVQVALHPSPSEVPASSHSSTASSRRPLPQLNTHTDGSPVHAYPGSSWQLGSQPSPPSVPASSHCSVATSTTPSPHVVAVAVTVRSNAPSESPRYPSTTT